MSIRFGTRSGFSSRLSHLSLHQYLFFFFSHTVGIKKEVLSHHSVEKIKSDRVRQVSSIVPDTRHPVQSSYPS